MYLKPLHIILIGVVIAIVAIFAVSMVDNEPKKTSSGFPAPPVEGLDPLGRKIELQQFEGNLVILNFWASWSGPSREAHDQLESIYREYAGLDYPKADSLIVMMFSLDDMPELWHKAIEKDSISWAVHLSDFNAWESVVSQVFSLQTIPSNVLIGPNGLVIGQDLSPDEIREALDRQLGTAQAD
jgi:thiol-disulfide isomerase/thioredoxin